MEFGEAFNPGGSVHNFFFTYKANKFVRIRSKKPAVLNRLCQLAVFSYICGYAILYKNKHLLPLAVHGSVRMTMQQPTQNCNPMHAKCKSDYTPMSWLPYCSQYSGVKPSRKASSFVPWSDALKSDADKLKSAGMQKQCLYKDSVNLTFAFPVPGTLFMQTRASKLPQLAQCKPSEENEWQCDGSLFQMTADSSKEDYYFADVERFTVLIDHAYRARLPMSGEVVSGRASELQGCAQTSDLDRCIPIANKPDQNDVVPSVFTLGGLGNIISLGDLLRLADKRGESLLDEVNDHHDSRRWNGGVLHVNVEYESVHEWTPRGSGEVKYVLSAQLLAQSEFKNMFGAMDDEGNRMIHDVHGFMVMADVHGTMYVFDITYLCQVLTTSVGMMAIASLVVNSFMTSCLQHKKQFQICTVQPSINFDTEDGLEMARESGMYTGYSDELALGTKKPSMVEDSTRLHKVHGKVLHDLAAEVEGGHKEVSSDKLLHILLMFEQRLNSLDGLDEEFVLGGTHTNQKQMKVKALASSAGPHLSR